MNKKEFIKIYNKQSSLSGICRELGYKVNGTGIRKVKKYIKMYGLTIKLGKPGGDHNTKYIKIFKICPICGNKFETKKGSKNEKITCSQGCANTHFRTGKNHSSFRNNKSSYRNLAILTYGYKCAICDETNVVEVHHLDENKTNNLIENLIVLCPNHHAYIHRGFEELISEKIIEWKKVVQIKNK